MVELPVAGVVVVLAVVSVLVVPVVVPLVLAVVSVLVVPVVVPLVLAVVSVDVPVVVLAVSGPHITPVPLNVDELDCASAGPASSAAAATVIRSFFIVSILRLGIR
jgi:hypothetical protein